MILVFQLLGIRGSLSLELSFHMSIDYIAAGGHLLSQDKALVLLEFLL